MRRFGGIDVEIENPSFLAICILVPEYTTLRMYERHAG